MFMLSPVQFVHAETSSNYWVAVNPTIPDSPMYTSVGQNWTFAYEAVWSYGDKTGQPIENATVTIQVNSTIQNKVADLHLNTTSGTFSFNYTSLTADILTFNVTKLVTTENEEFYLNAYDVETERGPLQSRVVTVYYDTLHVALVDSDTTILGATAVSVNVTYQLLPEEGLALESWATYSGQTFLPKIAHGQTVIINGGQAQETAMPGIYTAEVAGWFPTAYIHVAASQQNWTTTYTGFGFTHVANSPTWGYAVAFAGVALTATASLKLVLLRKSNNDGLIKRSNLPFFAGTLLAVASAISLYWTAVGIDGALAGFDWAFLAGFGLVSGAVGFVGAIMAFKRRKQAFAIASIIVPLMVNSVVVKTALDVYQLTTPWMVLIGAFAVAVVSGLLIANSENQAAQPLQE